MKNKLNEASIKIDVNGLESSDFDTLSRMLALAGEAEGQGANPGFSDLPKMEPFDFDAAGSDETQSIMDPNGALEPSVPGDDGMGALDSAVDDLSGTVMDFGADEESDDLGLDMDGAPALELDSTEREFEAPEDDFDLDRMGSLAGIQESLTSDIDKAADAEVEEDDQMEDDEEEAASNLDEALLPDLSLEEDADSTGDDAHGPYRSEGAARDDAEASVGGDFIIIPTREGYYWKHKEADTSSAHGPYQSEAGARDDAEERTGGLNFFIHRRPDGYYWTTNIQESYDDHRDFGDDHHKVDSPEHGPFKSEREAVHDGMVQTDGDAYEHFAVIRGKDGFYWRENTQPVHEDNDHRDFGDDHHAVDSKEHGPFRTEREAVHDGMKVTNGTEFEHFAVIPGKDGYYWRRNIQEELDNEPDPSMVDMSGIENSRHAMKRTPGTALGDNPLREDEDFSLEGNPSEEDPEEVFEEEDSVEDILESINARYSSFLKGL